MPQQRDFDPLTVASGFPPGLNTNSPAYDLMPDETPDGYGYDLTATDRLKAGSIPSGTSRIASTVTIDAQSYYWLYDRLWGLSGTALLIGSPRYKTAFVPNHQGELAFDEDANNLLAIAAMQPDSLFLAKSTGAYVITNCSDTRGYFQRSDILQGLGVAAASRVIVIDNVAYVSNASGLMAYVNQGASGQAKEVTEKIRNNLTGFTNLNLTADFAKKWIIAGTALVYDIARDKLFKYASGFRFTSRQFHLPTWEPMYIDRLDFVVEHSGSSDGTLTYQLKFEDDAWEEETQLSLPFQEEAFSVVTAAIDGRSCRRFQLRLTALSATKSIKEIRIAPNAIEATSYAR